VKPPVWLLDIDGVLNAASRKPPGFVWPRDQWIQDRATVGRHSLPILAARPVVDFIRQVHEQGRAEIRWHSTWQHDAKAVADLLDLPDFPVQEAPEWPDSAHDEVWWKLPAVQRVARDGWQPEFRQSRALVWTDDDAYGIDLPERDVAALRSTCPLLLVVPQARLGLTPKHLREIDAFLDEFGDRRSA
jgi:hypothetical protein